MYKNIFKIVFVILFYSGISFAYSPSIKVLFSYLNVYKYTPNGQKVKLNSNTFISIHEKLVVSEFSKLELLINNTTVKSQGLAEYIVQEIIKNYSNIYVSSGDYFISVPENEKCELEFTGGKILMENCQATVTILKNSFIRLNVLTGKAVLKTLKGKLVLVASNNTCKYSMKNGKITKGRFLVKYEYKKWMNFSSKDRGVIKTENGVVHLSDDVFTTQEEELVNNKVKKQIDYKFKTIEKTNAPKIRILRPGRFDDIGKKLKVAGLVDDHEIKYVEIHINGKFIKKIKVKNSFFIETINLKDIKEKNDLLIIATNKYGLEGRAKKTFNADVISPEITIFSTIEKNSYIQTIRGIVDDYTVKDVTIIVNSGRNFEKRYIVPVHGLSFIKDIEILEGNNQIDVYAEDNCGNIGKSETELEFNLNEYNTFFGTSK